jgi:chaperone modulatory protein CbpM
MKKSTLTVLTCQVVEEDVEMSLGELCQACGANDEMIRELVAHGVLEPRGEAPQGWVFVGASLGRTRQALRLIHDLEVNLPGAALALDLMDQIQRLQQQLQAATQSPGDG